jgi:hypothetical protein
MQKTRLRSWLAWTPVLVWATIMAVMSIGFVALLCYMMFDIVVSLVGWYILLVIPFICLIVWFNWAIKYIKVNHADFAERFKTRKTL